MDKPAGKKITYLIIYKVASILHYVKRIRATDAADATRQFRHWRAHYPDWDQARKARLILPVKIA
jgi:hypothetical protein